MVHFAASLLESTLVGGPVNVDSKPLTEIPSLVESTLTKT